MRKRKILAFACLSLGFLANPWTLGVIFSPDGKVGAPDLICLILLFDLFFIFYGLNGLFDWVKWQEQLLILGSFLFMLFALEAILRTGLLDQKDSDTPLWFPEKFQIMNRKLNADKKALQNANEFGFSDTNHQRRRKPGKKRIAVLGDSFVHGDGIQTKDIWSHKLQEKFKHAGRDDVEILTWGLSGWSTQDQLKFLKEKGKDFEIDTLIIGHVTNDPDMKRVKIKLLRWHLYLKTLKLVFRESMNFIGNAVNSILRSFVLKDWGYHVWEKELHSDENLVHYTNLLEKLVAFCKKQSWKLYIVFTPANHMPHHREYFSKVEKIYKKLGVTTLNLYPKVKNELGHLPNRKLWANPANAHPGPLVTEVIAQSVFEFLQEHLKESRLTNTSSF